MRQQTRCRYRRIYAFGTMRVDPRLCVSSNLCAGGMDCSDAEGCGDAIYQISAHQRQRAGILWSLSTSGSADFGEASECGGTIITGVVGDWLSNGFCAVVHPL